jgi:hypothetical protein
MRAQETSNASFIPGLKSTDLLSMVLDIRHNDPKIVTDISLKTKKNQKSFPGALFFNFLFFHSDNGHMPQSRGLIPPQDGATQA